MKTFLSLFSLLVLGINGQQEKPWLVKLIKGENHVCNGVLASNYHIITAAQCKEGIPEEWKAVELNGNSYQLSSWKNHPEFTADKRDYDVAVWTLKEPLNLTSYVTIGKGDRPILSFVPFEVIDFGSDGIRSKPIQAKSKRDCIRAPAVDEPQNQFCFDEFETCDEKPGSPIFVRRHTSTLLGLISDCHRIAYHNTKEVQKNFFEEFFATPPPIIPSESYKLITKDARPVDPSDY